MRDGFQGDLNKSLKQLRYHKTLGFICRILTFNYFKNEKNIKIYREIFDRCKKDIKDYDMLVAKSSELDKILETIEIDGVRVSKHVFADLPVVGGEDYGADWDILQKTILSRDNYECQEADGYCDGPLQVHHIVRLSKGGSNAPDNLITLCLYHHCLKHPHMMEQYYGNLRRRY